MRARSLFLLGITLLAASIGAARLLHPTSALACVAVFVGFMVGSGLLGVAMEVA